MVQTRQNFRVIWKMSGGQGVEISGTADNEKNEQLFLDYDNCYDTAVNGSELRQDFLSVFPDFNGINIEQFNISQKQRMEIVTSSIKWVSITLPSLPYNIYFSTFLCRYCPKVNTLLRCNNIVSPFLNDCLDDEELASQRVVAEIYQSITNYFCKNERAPVNHFIDGKVIECGIKKRDEIKGCWRIFRSNFYNREMVPVYRMYEKKNVICRWVLENNYKKRNHYTRKNFPT